MNAACEATLWGISEDDRVYPPAISRGSNPDDTLRDRRGQWKQVLRVEGNYQIHRRHDLPELTTAGKLRVVAYATNGDASATICEVGVY